MALPIKIQEPITTARRVCETADLRHLILEAADPATYRALSHSNSNFFASAHVPVLWAKQYAPAKIDLPSRTIQTGMIPSARGNLSKSREPRSIPPTYRGLGTYKGENWTLKCGLDVSAIRSQKARDIINSVSAMQSGDVHGYYRYQNDGQYNETLKDQDRLVTYAVMRNRAYRVRHNLHIPTNWRHIGLASTLIVSLPLVLGISAASYR